MAARPAAPPAFSTHSVSSVALSSTGSLLAAAHGAGGGTLAITRVPAPSVACTHLTPGPSAAVAPAAAVTGVAWDGDSRVYTADERGALSLYTLTGATLARTRRTDAAHSGAGLTGVAAGPGLVATAGKDGLVKAWDPVTGSCVARLKGHRGEARSVCAAASDDGGVAVHLLASAGRDRTVRLWDVRAANARPVHVFAGHAGWVHDVALTGGACPRVLSCGGDKTVRVWSLTRMAEEAVLSGHEYRVWAVAADPGGEFAVSGSTDLSVRCWGLGETPNTEAEVWLGHGDNVVSVAVARDASVAMSSSENGSVVLWDVARMRGKAPRSPAAGANSAMGAGMHSHGAPVEAARSPTSPRRPQAQQVLSPRTSPPTRVSPVANNNVASTPPVGAPQSLSESPRRTKEATAARAQSESPARAEAPAIGRGGPVSPRTAETSPRRVVVSPNATPPARSPPPTQGQSPRQAAVPARTQLQSPLRTDASIASRQQTRSPPGSNASNVTHSQAVSPRRTEQTNSGRPQPRSPPVENALNASTAPHPQAVSPRRTETTNAGRPQTRSPPVATALNASNASTVPHPQVLSPRRAFGVPQSPPQPQLSSQSDGSPTRPQAPAQSARRTETAPATLAPSQPSFRRQESPNAALPEPRSPSLGASQGAVRQPSQSPPRAAAVRSPTQNASPPAQSPRRTEAISPRAADTLVAGRPQVLSPRRSEARALSSGVQSPRLVDVLSVGPSPTQRSPVLAKSPLQGEVSNRTRSQGQSPRLGEENSVRATASPQSPRFFDERSAKANAVRSQAEPQSRGFFDAPSGTLPKTQSPAQGGMPSPPQALSPMQGGMPSMTRSPPQMKSTGHGDVPSRTPAQVQSPPRPQAPMQSQRFFDALNATKPLSKSPPTRSPPQVKSPRQVDDVSRAARAQVLSPRRNKDSKPTRSAVPEMIPGLVDVPIVTPPRVETASATRTHVSPKQSPPRAFVKNQRPQPVSPPSRSTPESARPHPTKPQPVGPSTPPTPNSGAVREGRTHSHSPRSPVESSPSVSMGRIRFLEDQVAVRDGELATRDKEIAARDDEITELKKEAQLLKTRLAAAESLAKEANVRALAAGNGFDGPRTTDVTTEVDSSVPLNRISKVTGQLKALAERLDEMVEDTAG